MRKTLAGLFFKVLNTLIDKSVINIDGLYGFLVKKIEEKQDVYFTEHKRPKFSDKLLKTSAPATYREIAIIIQGPVLKTDSFTLETVKLYKKNFTDSCIIVSTWDDEDQLEIAKLEAEGVFIILNKKPSYPGISNINYQISCTSKGLLKALELGAKHALKTRTDQRIYNDRTLDYFLNLLLLFPVLPDGVQQARLIVPSLNTFIYRMYGISDMLMFGTITDMLLYWDSPLDNRVFENVSGIKQTVEQFAKMRACEIYLCTEFLKKINRPILWSLEDSWEVFASCFCIIDHFSIDLFWPKYHRIAEFRNRNYSAFNTHQPTQFCDWLNMYYGNQKDFLPGILTRLEAETFT